MTDWLKTDEGLAYSFQPLVRARSSKVVWLVHVNGLGLDQTFWSTSIAALQDELRNWEDAAIYSTTYDRQGQGLSAIEGSLPAKHDLTYSVAELHRLLQYVSTTHLKDVPENELRMIMVAHSIGVPLLRLFLADWGGSWPIFGTVLIDSNMANVDMARLLPDPSLPDFDDSKLPADTNLETLSWSRENLRCMFSPDVPNKENLDRTTLPGLLPFADRPVFSRRPDGKELALEVVAHDPETFAEESLKICTRGLTVEYVQPVWHQYNLDLLKLTGREDVDGSQIIVAIGSGHFVQRDNPQVVANTVRRMIERVVKD